MSKKTHMETPAPSEIEQALAALSLDDLPLEDEPSRALEGIPTTPESLAARLMGQVVYQINRRIRELDARDPEGMNRARLAELMGVSKPQVSRLLKAQKNTTLLTVAKAALALGLTEAVLKLIPEEADQVDEAKAFVEADPGPWWPLTQRCHGEGPFTVRASVGAAPRLTGGAPGRWADAVLRHVQHSEPKHTAPVRAEDFLAQIDAIRQQNATLVQRRREMRGPTFAADAYAAFEGA